MPKKKGRQGRSRKRQRTDQAPPAHGQDSSHPTAGAAVLSTATAHNAASSKIAPSDPAPSEASVSNAAPNGPPPGETAPADLAPDHLAGGDAGLRNTPPTDVAPGDLAPGEVTPRGATPSNASLDDESPGAATPGDTTPTGASPSKAAPNDRETSAMEAQCCFVHGCFDALLEAEDVDEDLTELWQSAEACGIDRTQHGIEEATILLGLSLAGLTREEKIHQLLYDRLLGPLQDAVAMRDASPRARKMQFLADAKMGFSLGDKPGSFVHRNYALPDKVLVVDLLMTTYILVRKHPAHLLPRISAHHVLVGRRPPPTCFQSGAP